MCPRCDYDLSGHDAARREHPGASGICPECGLDFSWAEVFNPGLTRLPWFFENASGLAIVAAVKTMLRASVVFPFWGKVRLENRVRLGRVLAWLAICCAAVPLPLAGMILFRTAQSGAPALDVLVAAAISESEELVDVFRGPYIWAVPIWARLAFAAAIMHPLVFLALPITRSGSKVSLRHVLRAAAYSASVFFLSAVISFACRATAAVADLAMVRTRYSGGLVGLLFALDPWSRSSNGRPGRDALDRELAFGFVLSGVVYLYWLAALEVGFRMKKQDRRPAFLSMAVCSLLLGLITLTLDVELFQAFL
ncbi:MAG: hypothetical protein ACOYN0_02210 [Phycisphaerales bacterium]